MKWTALTALFSHWRRQPLQFFTLIAGLTLATALWSAVQAINAEARRSYAAAEGVLGLGSYETLADPAGRIPLETFAKLRRAGWPVSPILEGRVLLGDLRIEILGLDFLSAPPANLPGSAELQTDLSPAEIFLPPGLAFVAPETLRELENIDGLPRLIADGSLPPGRLVSDISVANRLLEAGGEIDRLILLDGAPDGTPRTLAPRLQRLDRQSQGEISRLTDSFHLNLTAFGLLSFAVGLFIVHGTIGLAFEQRRTVFRTLRALGLPLRTLLGLLLAEILLLALLAGGFGILLGYLIASALLPDVAATLRGLYGASIPGSLAFNPAWAASGLGVALVGALVAAAHGLNAIRRMPLLASARPRAWAIASKASLRRQALAGIALLAMGVAAPVLADGLLAGFALMGGLLLGAALLLPLLLGTALSAGAALARGPVAQWFWADTRQQLPGLSLALMSLLLALATNIGVSTMVSSFRLTFTGWLDQRLVSQLYVTAPGEDEAERLREWLAPRADAVLPIWKVDTPLHGAPGEIYGIVDHQVYRTHWPLLAKSDAPWEELYSGRGALINEQLAYREDLSPGEPVTLGPGWTLPVSAVYSDYGNPAGQAIVNLPSLLERHPGVPRLRHGILTDDPEGLAHALHEEFGLPRANLIDNGSLKATSLQIFERTFTVTGALNVLTLSVAGFAILTALLTLSSMRLPQLAPPWALGLTRAQLARLETLRSLALAALTFALALPTGLVLAWSLLAVVNVEAFGWRLPMFLFPAQWLWLLALSLIAALLAAFLPVRRLARTDPSQFLKVFADER